VAKMKEVGDWGRRESRIVQK